jgi:hypothetical protein
MQGVHIEEVDENEQATSSSAVKVAKESEPLSTYRGISLVTCEPHHVHQEGTFEFLDGCTACTSFRGKKWFMASISCDEAIKLPELHAKIAKIFQSLQGVAISRETDKCVIAMLCVDRFKGFEFAISGHVIQCFSLGVGSSKRVLKVFGHVTKNTSEYLSTMEIKQPGDRETAAPQMTMDEAFKLTEKLSGMELAQAVGDAKLMDPVDRSDLQKVLCRCEVQLRQMRAKVDRAMSLIRYVGIEVPTPVALSRFRNLSLLLGTGHNPLTGGVIRVNYQAYLDRPELHMHYAACLIGAPGVGKTPLAKSSAIFFAVSYQTHHYQWEDEKCYFVQASTIDTLKELNASDVLKPWVPIFLDEFEWSDQRQQGGMSDSAVKILCDTWEGGTVRTRHHDLVLPPRMPRIFCANCGTAAEWLGTVGATNELSRGAVMKRMLFFEVTGSLMPLGLQNREASVMDPGLRAALVRGRGYIG